MKYIENINKLLEYDRKVGLLLEDVIDPTLDSIGRLIDVLTGVGGQLRESSLSVVSRVVSNNNSLHVKQLSYEIADLKIKIKELSESITDEMSDDEIEIIQSQMLPLQEAVKAKTNEREKVRNSMFSLSTQNMLFKMAFSRMTEIAGGMSGGSSNGKIPPSVPSELLSNTEELGNRVNVVRTKIIELQKQLKSSMAAVENNLFSKYNERKNYLEPVTNFCLSILVDTVKRLEQRPSEKILDQIEPMIDKINLNLIVSVSSDEIKNYKQHKIDSATNKKDKAKAEKVTEDAVAQELANIKIHSEFDKRFGSIYSVLLTTAWSSDDINNIINLVSKIPMGDLASVALDKNDPGRKHFFNLTLPENVKDTIAAAVAKLQKIKEAQGDPEGYLAKIFILSRASSKKLFEDSDSSVQDIGIDETLPDDTIQDDSTDKKNEANEFMQIVAILGRVTTEEELNNLQKLIKLDGKTPEFVAKVSRAIEKKREYLVPSAQDTLETAPAPVAGVSPEVTPEVTPEVSPAAQQGGSVPSLEGVAKKVAANKTITVADLHLVAGLLGLDDLTDAAYAVLDSVEKQNLIPNEEIPQLMNSMFAVASNAQARGIGPEDEVAEVPQVTAAEAKAEFMNILSNIKNTHLSFAQLGKLTDADFDAINNAATSILAKAEESQRIMSDKNDPERISKILQVWKK